MNQGGFTFSQVPKVNIPRSTFNRSHGHKTTFNTGLLIPIFVDEALPGDTFSVNLHALARMATPIFPIMDNMHLDFFFFAVPNRLVWDNWQQFCGEAPSSPGTGYNGPNDFLIPRLASGNWQSLSIADYMGLPVGVTVSEASALYMRAYNLIWNEWFRDENLQAKVTVPKGNGPDPINTYALLPRGKRHDYFTSCLPWPQKGPAVEVPVGGFAPVIPDAAGSGFSWSNVATNGGLPHGAPNADASGNVSVVPSVGDGQLVWGQTGLKADLSNATAVTINALREAFQVQRMYEKDARGGTRYTEILRAHFGVVSPDARLQRPEFLGGGSVPVVVNPVSQTSETTEASPQGNLAAFAVAGVRGIGFRKSFVEHSIILGLVEARPDITYQQGMARMWTRRTRFDFYWPSLAHIGEQAVLMKEIFSDGSATDQEVFGYQERWAEYRYFPSRVSAAFRTLYPTGQTPASLDKWHLAQYFGSKPTLSASFIEEPRDVVPRVVAVPSEPEFLFDSHFTIKCARPMPTYSVPGLIDHF